MTRFRCSVLVPSWKREGALRRCLDSLVSQSCPPYEVHVIWQGDDRSTASAALELSNQLPIRVHHCQTDSIVLAENVGLEKCEGDIVAMIDDDAVATPDWLAKHLSQYADGEVGAVGGGARNYSADGTPFPIQRPTEIGRICWSGRLIGNMFDHPAEYRAKGTVEVDHLVGYNLSFRRCALDRFEPAMRGYAQFFEAEACQQIRSRGYRVLFDYDNPVEHYPTNTMYDGRRTGDPTMKIYAPAYNHAFLLSKHTRGWLRGVRLAHLMIRGSVAMPGLLTMPVAVKRHGDPIREAVLLGGSLKAKWEGWRDGRRAQ